jgi:hypothetical protein
MHCRFPRVLSLHTLNASSEFNLLGCDNLSYTWHWYVAKFPPTEKHRLKNMSTQFSSSYAKDIYFQLWEPQSNIFWKSTAFLNAKLQINCKWSSATGPQGSGHCHVECLWGTDNKFVCRTEKHGLRIAFFYTDLGAELGSRSGVYNKDYNWIEKESK